MRKLFIYVIIVLATISANSCGKMLDMFKDINDELDDVLENYEERLSLSDDEMNEYLRGKWTLNKVGRSLNTNNKYYIEKVEEDPNLISSIESLEIDGSTFKFNFKKATKFERHFWTDDVEHMQTEDLWFDTYTAEEGSTTLYVEFDSDDVEVFTLMDYTNEGFEYLGIMLFGEDLLGNGSNLKVNRMVIQSASDTYYEFIPAK